MYKFVKEFGILKFAYTQLMIVDFNKLFIFYDNAKMDGIKIERLNEDIEILNDEYSINSGSDSKYNYQPKVSFIQTRIVDSEFIKKKYKESKSSNYNRVQHYREAWERNPKFVGWLTRGRNSRKARCLVCRSEMTADISVLKYHAQCNKHIARLATVDTTVTKLISRKVKALEPNGDVVKKGYYNSSWEQDPRYASWIKPGDNSLQARCCICDVQLAAETGVLRRHLATYSHMKAAEFDDQMQAVSSIVSEKDESIAIQPNVEDEMVLELEIIHQEDDTVVIRHTKEHPVTAKLQFRVKDNRGEPLEKLSFLIGKFLLKGFKMLNAACEKCGCVMLCDRKHHRHCVGCQYGLMEEINATVPGCPQRPLVPRRVSAGYPHSRHTRRHPATRDSYGSDGNSADDISIAVTALCPDVTVTAGSGGQQDMGMKEEVEELTEIVINEDSSAAVLCHLAVDDENNLKEQICEMEGVDLSSEVSSLVHTLHTRLVELTQYLLEEDGDDDHCLDHLDRTVMALTKLKEL